MQFPLDLTENNVRRLINGHPIQLKNNQLHGTKHHIVVHPATHSRLMKAKSMGKGARLALTPQELTASGEGWRDILDKIKSGARWLKQNVISTEPYQSVVRPIAKEVVSKVTAPVIAALPTMLQQPAQQALQKASEVTQAFGLAVPEGTALEEPKLMMKQPRKSKPKTAKPKAKRAPKTKAVAGSFLIN